jgi:HSP20 family molecular chaperone IbpA
MSNTNTRNILLSQPKTAQGETIQVLTLTHVTVQTETSTEVKVEVPGIDPSTIGVGFENSLLHVHCDRGELTLPIDPTVDVSKIKADILWGLLTLSIPLPEIPEARTIKVSVHDTAPTPVKKPAAKVAANEFTKEDQGV